jgi:hypothetical protein
VCDALAGCYMSMSPWYGWEGGAMLLSLLSWCPHCCAIIANRELFLLLRLKRPLQLQGWLLHVDVAMVWVGGGSHAVVVVVMMPSLLHHCCQLRTRTHVETQAAIISARLIVTCRRCHGMGGRWEPCCCRCCHDALIIAQSLPTKNSYTCWDSSSHHKHNMVGCSGWLLHVDVAMVWVGGGSHHVMINLI